MIDTGLLISIAVLVTVPVLWARAARILIDGERLTDAAIAPLVAGLVAARIATLILDDPGALRSFKDAAVIRGGVDFWPGVAIAMAVSAWGAHRSGNDPAARLAQLSPFALVAYSLFEATCFLREGCLGPRATIGLRPPGLQSTMFPLGWVVAVVVLSTAMVIHRSNWLPTIRVWVAVAVVSSARAIVSFWLPKIGDGLTRAHQWSLVIAVASVSTGLLRWMGGGHHRRAGARTSGADGVVDHGR